MQSRRGNLSASISKTPKKTGEAAEAAAEEVGQLYTDLLRYMRDDNTGQQWMFTPDVIEDGVTKADMEDKIIKHIEELIDNQEVSLAREFDIDLNDPDLSDITLNEWDAKFANLKNAIKGQGNDGQKFVNIYGYKNIIKTVD